MANKKKIEAREKQLTAQRTERNIRYIGLGIIVLLLVAGVWYFLPKSQGQNQQNDQGQSPQTEQSNLGYGSDTAACQPFADIPVA